MKTKNKIFILALVGMLLLPYAILRAQNVPEIQSSCQNFPPPNFCPDGVDDIIVIGTDDNGCSIYGCQHETIQPTLINISISKENGFVPKQFEAQAGKTITIELTSEDNSVHELRFAEKNLRHLTIGVNPGQTTSITFDVPKELKSYPFYCTAPGHKQRGETGTMVVIKPILTNPVEIDEDITAEDLEIEEPKMLSTNIFYPLKR